MTLPPRIRGPRAKADRRAMGLDEMYGEHTKAREARPPKVKRRSPAHCNFVRDHDCCVPGCTARPIEVAHVRRNGSGAMSQKPSDRYTVSLCRDHHAESHRGERTFEERYGIDLWALAAEFVRRSPKRKELEQMP